MSFFSGENQSPADAQQQQTTNQEDWLAKVISEKGEQWSDPNTLAKGYVNAQEYIKQLEQQATELREDLGKMDYAEQLLKKLQEGQSRPSAGESQAANASGTNAQEPTAPNASELKDLIEQTLTEREQANTAAQNLQETDSKLQSLYGTEAEKVMEQKIAELGMSKDRLRSLAAESPTAFFKLIGEEVKKESNPVTQGTVNTNAGSFSQSSKRDFQYYQNLRRQDSRTYYSPKVQNQMLQDRLELGDSFYNN